MCGFQITHSVNQCTTCQHTNYYDTVNCSKLNYFGQVIYAHPINTHQAKLLIHQSILLIETLQRIASDKYIYL